jgi:hypothetical protein
MNPLVLLLVFLIIIEVGAWLEVLLHSAGFLNVQNVAGFWAWHEAALPPIRT